MPLDRIGENTVSVAIGDVGVELGWIGEGHNGDYDPRNPHDEKLLRFTVLITHDDPDYDEAVECGSYCTNLPTTIPVEQAIVVANMILGAVHARVRRDESIKVLCEAFSWADLDGDKQTILLKVPLV